MCVAGCCAAAEAVRVWRVWSEDGTVCDFHPESTAACQLQSEIPTACWLQSECACYENLMLNYIWSQCMNPEVALADTQHMKPHITVRAEYTACLLCAPCTAGYSGLPAPAQLVSSTRSCTGQPNALCYLFAKTDLRFSCLRL